MWSSAGSTYVLRRKHIAGAYIVMLGAERNEKAIHTEELWIVFWFFLKRDEYSS